MGSYWFGTLASHVLHLSSLGYQVTYERTSFEQLRVYLARHVPCVVFLRTGRWSISTIQPWTLAQRQWIRQPFSSLGLNWTITARRLHQVLRAAKCAPPIHTASTDLASYATSTSAISDTISRC